MYFGFSLTVAEGIANTYTNRVFSPRKCGRYAMRGLPMAAGVR